MNFLNHILVATALIAAMMLLRVIVGHAVLAWRLRDGRACSRVECFGGCDQRHPDNEDKGSERSADHAH